MNEWLQDYLTLTLLNFNPRLLIKSSNINIHRPTKDWARGRLYTNSQVKRKTKVRLLSLAWHLSGTFQVSFSQPSWLRVQTNSNLNCFIIILNSMLVFDCSWVIDLLNLKDPRLCIYIWDFWRGRLRCQTHDFHFLCSADGCNEAVSDVRPGSDPANIASSWSSRSG